LAKIHADLDVKLQKKVDLISENGLNKSIKEQVLKEATYFYES